MKSGLLYLLLVGLPVLALVGVVRIGERILPPTYVGGTWRVVEKNGPPPANACVQSPSGSEPLEVEIIQSGTVLEMTFRSRPPVRASARLHGDTLRTTRLSATPSCSVGWMLEARILGADDAARLSGRWTLVGCDSCAAEDFTAIRVASPLVKR